MCWWISRLGFNEMLRRLRNHLSYANVVASLALFIALGGASYAAFHLPAASVGTAQIKNHAVTLVKLGHEVGRTFRGRVGAPGPAGPRGPAGPKGPQGPPGVARAFGEVSATGTVTNSRGNPVITHPSTGRYCLSLPGFDPSVETIAVTLNVQSTFNAAPPSEQPGDGNVCPVGTWEIATGKLIAPGGGGLVRFINADQAYSFIAP
jgi:hypothetical protein